MSSNLCSFGASLGLAIGNLVEYLPRFAAWRATGKVLSLYLSLFGRILNLAFSRPRPLITWYWFVRKTESYFGGEAFLLGLPGYRAGILGLLASL